MERNLEYGFQEGIDYTPYQMVHPSNLQEIEGWAMKDSSKGTASTRKSEEAGFARTFFETIKIQRKDVKVKKIVVTKKGLDYLVNNFSKLL